MKGEWAEYRDRLGVINVSRLRNGFTLIELLVVIAIIAILAAILFPVYSSTKAKALQSSCSSNIKQIVMALIRYADDWNGTLPGLNAFGDLVDASNTKPNRGPLWQYVKSTEVFKCPAQIWKRNPINSLSPHKFNYTYTMNGYMTIAERDRGLADYVGEKVSKSRNPSRTILLVDENCDETKNEGQYVVNDALFIWEDRTGDRHPGSEHVTMINGVRYLCSGSAPVGYLDGHNGIVPGLIKWQSPEGKALFYK